MTILDIASQLDLYAGHHETDATKHKARYEELSRDPGYSVTAINHVLYQRDVAERQAHQLRFAATFLREHGVLQWTADLPTRAGTYWFRWSTAASPNHLVYVLEGEPGVWLASDAADPHDLDHLTEWAGGQFAGPLQEAPP